ncbi:sodium-coupled monocarboxylate transporter 1-like [Apostichopus japonicus]|uniref:sodium-coupled monocarboxylate transporter 1-like n=1 Tax=Stichopus japonicus TaxID=307972 RepID=UPI003AB592FB
MAYLSAVDYVLLALFLGLSASIGVYHAFRGGRQRTANEYLLADRKMNPIPVTMSVVVSVLSSVTFLGTPADTYIYGPQYWVVLPAKIIPMVIIPLSFVPIFYKLGVTSIYEYIGMRFGRVVRLFGMLINCLYLLLYLGVVIYGPALALNAVTGLSIAGSTIAVGLVCTFYTTIGGIKAVLWADVFQSIIFLAGFILTIVACCIHVGGLTEVFRINVKDGRGTFFDFRLDPKIRHSFWSVFIGFGFLMTSYAGTNQIIVQRYLTCRSLRQSQWVAAVGNFCIGIVEIIAILTGLSMYAYFAGCDPFTLGEVQKPDQLMAYIIIDIFNEWPGVSGFLISAVFSATLSTISSGMNAFATLFGQDIIKVAYPNMSDFKFTLILKLISVIFGLLTIAMAFLASSLGGILPLVLSLIGILNGPILGVFSLGIYFPRANSKGALVGMLAALAIGIWLKVGSYVYPAVVDKPPLFTDQCPNANITLTDQVVYTVTEDKDEIDPNLGNIYALSYAYYTPLTCFITVIVGLFVSLITHPTDPSSLNPDLVSPIGELFACCLPKRLRGHMPCSVRENVEVEPPHEQEEVVKMAKLDE